MFTWICCGFYLSLYKQKKNIMTKSFFPSNINLDTVLFYDAETRPIDTYENISTLPEYKDLHDLWNIRVELLKNQDRIKGVKTEKEIWDEYSGLYPEYSVLICFSLGYYSKEADEFRTKSFSGDEKQIVVEMTRALNKFVKLKRKFIVGANITKFDNTYFTRKCFQFRILPSVLIAEYDRKPWDTTAVDITDIWKSKVNLGDATLASICRVLGVKTPKDGISGKDVWKFFQKGEVQRIISYCEKDVFACYEIFVILSNLEVIE